MYAKYGDYGIYFLTHQLPVFTRSIIYLLSLRCLCFVFIGFLGVFVSVADVVGRSGTRTSGSGDYQDGRHQRHHSAVPRLCTSDTRKA